MKQYTTLIITTIILLIENTVEQEPPAWKRPNELRTISARDDLVYDLFGATYGDPQKFSIDLYNNGTITNGYRIMKSPEEDPQFHRKYGNTWTKAKNCSFVILGEDYQSFMVLDFDDDLKISQKTEVNLGLFEATANVYCFELELVSDSLFLFCVLQDDQSKLIIPRFDISREPDSVKAFTQF